jgi:hypothetical protein
MPAFVVEAWDRWRVDNEIVAVSLDREKAEQRAKDYNAEKDKPARGNDWHAEVVETELVE